MLSGYPCLSCAWCNKLSWVPHNFLLTLSLSKGVAMVWRQPSPLVTSPCGLKLIKRCSYGSDTTKPPSDFLYIRAAAETGLTKLRFVSRNSCKHTWCKKEQRPRFSWGSSLLYNIYIVISMYIRRARGSSIVRPKKSYIPRLLGLLLWFTWVFVLSNIDEVVWPVVSIFADHKRSFPRWG